MSTLKAEFYRAPLQTMFSLGGWFGWTMANVCHGEWSKAAANVAALPLIVLTLMFINRVRP